MQQIRVPRFPISEKTTWSELPAAIATAFDAYANDTDEAPPLLIFEPIEVSNVPGYNPGPSEAPEELVVVVVDPVIRNAVFEALKRVESREPAYPHNRPVKTPKIKENTPLKSIYRQMAEMPATVFSLTMPSDDGEPGTIFFIRTAFTISEFRREIEKPI